MNKFDKVTRYAVFLMALVFSTPALANVVWPGLVLAPRLLFWAVPAGIALETLFLVQARRMKPRAALIPIAIVNALSALIGGLGVAVGGLAWELTGGALLYKMLGVGTFNWFTWLITLGIAAALSYQIEVVALQRLFRITLSKRERWAFLAANAATTAIALGSFALIAPKF